MKKSARSRSQKYYACLNINAPYLAIGEADGDGSTSTPGSGTYGGVEDKGLGLLQPWPLFADLPYGEAPVARTQTSSCRYREQTVIVGEGDGIDSFFFFAEPHALGMTEICRRF